MPKNLLIILLLLAEFLLFAKEHRQMYFNFNGVYLQNVIYYSEHRDDIKKYDESIIPLGFSEKGSFAYLRLTYDYEPEKIYMEIIDLITDQYLATLDLYLKFKPGDNEEISHYLERNKIYILNKLKEYNIHLDGGKIKKFGVPFSVDGSKYYIESRCKYIGKQKNDYDSWLIQYEIYLYRNDKRKKICDITLEDMYSFIEDFNVDKRCEDNKPYIGTMLLSPYEDRIVIVISTFFHKFEDESFYKFRVTGAHLKENFK